MGWHILHQLLEQGRIQSTFPGKMWIVTMFLFRIIVVARIGHMVYEDEQEQFVCNTKTPGCKNVCFNRFSPMSQLRFWSFMLLIVSIPTILFFLYATHIIYHADVKYPSDEEEKGNEDLLSQQNSELHPPSLKRRRGKTLMPNGSASPPLYQVTTLLNQKNSQTRRRHRNNRVKQPIYKVERGDEIAYMKGTKRTNAERDVIEERKLKRRILEHPDICRAYLWHVLLRTLLEIGFILGQYYLYGWTVQELYECSIWPCPKTVDCFVSRPQEKTCLLWLMYGLGIIACSLSIAEFWALGTRANYATMCGLYEESSEERGKRLAPLITQVDEKHEAHPGHRRRLTSALSLDSLSSDTDVSSV